MVHGSGLALRCCGEVGHRLPSHSLREGKLCLRSQCNFQVWPEHRMNDECYAGCIVDRCVWCGQAPTGWCDCQAGTQRLITARAIMIASLINSRSVSVAGSAVMAQTTTGVHLLPVPPCPPAAAVPVARTAFIRSTCMWTPDVPGMGAWIAPTATALNSVARDRIPAAVLTLRTVTRYDASQQTSLSTALLSASTLLLPH